ncbi:3-oxoacyl-ACP reductase FabG [Haloarcula nitratireducens]|uniref:3-oxoacyl-ACP reductase FabG n=1 Tax=Haloarcula nitratireducens TaxID=2487749 RepID=A0AAW4PFP6_9EURY|nr:3-oxoacyl-ACP reductase FabG [Halomicroarcula nitratireducens]MBX0296135.1 3-oxoacyl-ACP reductase FabG [Halomicroarcula nitratireducens]
MTVDQKTVVITGAARGIGRGIAETFADNGARVVLVDVDEKAVQRAADEIDDESVEAHAGDVTELEEMEAIAEAAAERYGGIDIVCANAGIYPSASLEEMTEADWDRVQNVNLKGTFLTVKACLPYLKDQDSGRVLLTSSITGPMTGYPGWSHYGATKAGMLGFMRTAALELAQHDITVNAVLPGNIRTESLDELGEEYIERMTASVPLGTLGDPEDIAHALVFLASERAKFITGQTLVVDGGQTLPESAMALEDSD